MPRPVMRWPMTCGTRTRRVSLSIHGATPVTRPLGHAFDEARRVGHGGRSCGLCGSRLRPTLLAPDGH